MQKAIAFILLLALVGQTFRQGFYYIDYLVDKAAYAKYCINKAKPKLQCEGKCQFMKKLQAAEAQEQQKAPAMKLAGKVEIVPPQFQTASFDISSFSSKHEFILINEGSPIDHTTAIFHPPSA